MRFVGDPVAIVVAESRYIAEDGCELVEVDYEDLPPVATAAAALDAGGPRLFANLDDNIIGPHKRSEFGDVAGAFDSGGPGRRRSTSTCTATRTSRWRAAASSPATTRRRAS